MAKWEVNSAKADEYLALLEKLGQKTPEMIGRAIYPAAGLVIEEIKGNIRALPILPRGKRGTAANPIDGVTSAQRKGLEDGIGIAKLRQDGTNVNVKIGFTGYNSQVSDTSVKAGWTSKKQPNAMIARAVESGNSFRIKHPFIAPAVRKVKKTAEETINAEIEAEIKKLGF